jgi:hypothetical protein
LEIPTSDFLFLIVDQILTFTFSDSEKCRRS